MPRVETYDAPQVSPNALPGVRQSSVVSPALLGEAGAQQAEMGAGMLKAGNALGDVAYKMQVEDNETEAKALDTEFANFGRDVINGTDGDPSTGYLSKQGKNALEAYGATRDALIKKREELIGKASNDRVRNLLAQTFDRRIMSFRDTMDGHARQQRAAHMKATSELRIDSLAKDMADSWADPTKHAEYLAGLKGEAVSLAEVHGITDAREKDALVKQYTSTGHAGVIARMMSTGFVREAKDYLKTYNAEIDANVRTRLIDQLDTAGKKDDVVRVQRFLEQAPGGWKARYKMLGDAFDGGGKIAGVPVDGELYKQVRAGLEHMEAKARTDENRYEASVVGQAQDWVIKNPGRPVTEMPLNLYNGLKAKGHLAALDSFAQRASGGKDIKDDIENLGKVEQMIERGDITDRAQLNQYAMYFSNSTLKTLAVKLDKRETVAPTDIRRVFEERKGEKVNLGKMGDGARAEWMAFQQYILGNVKETKRPEDIDAWADRWFMKGYGKDNSLFANDPDTFGEARTKGRKDFVIAAQGDAQAHTDNALRLLERSGVPMPKDRQLGRDEFYTSYVLEAERWAGAQGVQNTPEISAAYALLKRSKKPVTPGNVEYIINQLKK